MCSSICKCIGCKNFEESPERKTLMHLADAAEVRVQQQTAAKTKLSSQISDLLMRTTPVISSGSGRYLKHSSHFFLHKIKSAKSFFYSKHICTFVESLDKECCTSKGCRRLTDRLVQDLQWCGHSTARIRLWKWSSSEGWLDTPLERGWGAQSFGRDWSRIFWWLMKAFMSPCKRCPGRGRFGWIWILILRRDEWIKHLSFILFQQ